MSHILSLAVIAYAFGFIPVAYALMGKGDAGTAFKIALLPGIVTILNGLILYWFGVPIDNKVLVLSATILTIAGMAFTAVGIAGFLSVQAKTLSLMLVFTAIFLIIYGLWIIAMNTASLLFMTIGLAVFLYGLAALGGGLPAFGMGAKAGGGLIALCSAINFILAISWQFGWIV